MPDNGKAEGMNESERMRILELLEQRKITAAEAAELLSALNAPPRDNTRRERTSWSSEEPQGERSRSFRVRVTDTRTGEVRANVSVPLSMLGVGIGLANRVRVGGVPLDAVVEAVRYGRRGTLFDVTGADQRVEIVVE